MPYYEEIDWGGLTLSRRVGERIRLECDGLIIWVEVASIQNGAVRLRFKAPQEVDIVREELIRKR